MPFPNITAFAEAHPGPYERQMGEMIARVLRVFAAYVPDVESHARVTELVETPTRWSAGHAVFDEVRVRLLAAMKAKKKPSEWQHHFEESCCQAVYNATNPPAPFDPGSAFFVVPQALGFASIVGIPPEELVRVLLRQRS